MQNPINHFQKSQLTHIPTKKFKDITVVLRFLIPLTKENATQSALLLYMMEDRNHDFPTKKAMLTQKDELYGTTFSTNVVGYGRAMALQISSKVMDPDYGDDDRLLLKHARWFNAMIEKPVIDDETLKEAKNQIRSALLRDLDNPQKYAQIKAFEALGPDHVISINIDGDITMLSSITVDDMKEFHSRLLTEAQRHLYVIGDIKQDMLAIYQQDSTYQQLHRRIESAYPIDLEDHHQLLENKKGTQTNFLKLYKTNVSIDHPLYLANRLASIALGQLPTSYLFMEIRERRSLCYFIHSQYIAFDGICLISTGIDRDNIDEVKKLIHKQVLAVQNIDSGLLKQAKTMIINAIRNSEDDILGYINLHYAHQLIDQHFDKDTLIQQIEAVTPMQIYQAVSLWEPLLEYVVQGG